MAQQLPPSGRWSALAIPRRRGRRRSPWATSAARRPSPPCRSCAKHSRTRAPRSAAWLLFFPNAPYIFTDLIHLTRPFLSNHYWVDLLLILICAVTGLVLGFVSLYRMQSIATQVFGRVIGWLFVAAAAGLSSVGVFLGRFLRFNSWDIFLRPARIYHRLDAWMDGRLGNQSTVAFLVLFATFLFLAYVMLYALTHLSPAQMTAGDERELKGA